MKALLLPQELRGTVVPPPSTNHVHCLIMGAALSHGVSHIHGLALSDTIKAMLNGIRSLGAQSSLKKEGGITNLEIMGTTPDDASSLPECDCGGFGPVSRLLIPLALALRGGGVFRRCRKLTRSLEPYASLFAEKGIECCGEGSTLTIRGRLKPGTYRLRGEVSPQLLAGLLFALPLLPSRSEILLSTPLESRSLVATALDTLARYGIAIETNSWSSFSVPGSQTYVPMDTVTEQDFSLAAFFYAAQGMGNPLSIQGMDMRSVQSESAIMRIAARLSDPGETHIDVRLFPDLVPAIAVQAALREGETTHILNAGSLRLEETDRLASLTQELETIGGIVREYADRLLIKGVRRFKGGETSSHGDDRVAMMLAVAATRSLGPIWIEGAHCVRRTYPSFWQEWKRLGGAVRLLHDTRDDFKH